jgi:hypothetical protein
MTALNVYLQRDECFEVGDRVDCPDCGAGEMDADGLLRLDRRCLCDVSGARLVNWCDHYAERYCETPGGEVFTRSPRLTGTRFDWGRRPSTWER